MKIYSCGLIGLGSQGRATVKFMEATRRATLFAASDSDAQTCASFEHGQSRETVRGKCYEDYMRMLRLHQLDVVAIATPPIRRCEMIKAALVKGCHVMVENPLACTGAECRAIIELVQRYPQLLVTVNEQWRWLPSWTAVRPRLPELIGRLRCIRMSGKGRHSGDELPRIVTHMLGMVTDPRDPLLRIVTTAYVQTVRSGSKFISFEDTHGMRVNIDLYHGGYNLDSCQLELVGDTGRVRLQGGFLERAWQIDKGIDAGEIIDDHVSTWEPIFEPLTVIVPGRETEALLDPRMNPSFQLWEQFTCALDDVRPENNPLPPRYLLLAVEAYELIIAALNSGGVATRAV